MPPNAAKTTVAGPAFGGSVNEVVITAIAKFQNWDKRECAVENAEAWKEEIARYLAAIPDVKIPKKIHQIWIGPKEPPCVWLDTWRVEYMHDNPHWEYQLWTDAEVEKLEMLNQDFYDHEKMWQCKADILRLEILWKYGGVYIDADMISLRKPLDEIIESAKDTGFVITFEPDTKDKAYSVIGNSIIAVTPQHPIIKMLMLYIRSVYPHKRPYHGVEWVTGPLAYTKCLVHPNMPMTVPPSHLFYPKFHFVPNPDAINLASFPDAYAFQFGYTCSGLEGWVKNNNRCRRAAYCAIHSKRTDWPLGRLVPFPPPPKKTKSLAPKENGAETIAAVENGLEKLTVEEPAPKAAPIPKVIHQLLLGTGGRPERWMSTWYTEFTKAHPGWTYRSWTLDQLRNNSWFCANLYSDARQMDPVAVHLLALEIIYKHGGVHVPLTATWAGNAAPLLPSANETGLFQGPANVIGAAPGDDALLERIRDLYNGAEPSDYVKNAEDPSGNIKVMAVNYPESASNYLSYPDWTRYLGAEQIFDFMASPATDPQMISWAYDSMVQTVRLNESDRDIIRTTKKRSIAVFDPFLFMYGTLQDAIPKLIDDLDRTDPAWRIMLLALEWQTGEDSTVVYRTTMPFRPPNARFVGFVCNGGAAQLLPPLSGKMDEAVVDGLLARQHELALYVGCQKFIHSKDLSDIYSGMPIVRRAFQQLANHEAPFEFDNHEIHGKMLKGFKDGRLVLEMQSDDERRVMYRSWNEDGAINCEVKLQIGAAIMVDWMKVFYAHQLIFEASQKRVN